MRLSCSPSDAKKDTPYWRLVPFEDICATNAMLGDDVVEMNMDSMVGNEPALQAFRDVWKFILTQEVEKTVMSLIRLGAIIIATNDCFREIISGSKSWEGRNNKTAMIWGSDEREKKEAENVDKGTERALVHDGTSKLLRIEGGRSSSALHSYSRITFQKLVDSSWVALLRFY